MYRMKYYSFVCCIMMAASCWCVDCAKMSRLTGLVKLIANRLDLQSIARQHDTENLFDKLNYLELRLNESIDNFQCSTTGQPQNDPSATRETEANNDMLRIMTAFKEEKQIIKTLQRQVPEVKKTVNSFDTMLGNLTSVVEAIRGEMCTPADLDSVSIIVKMEELFNPVKIVLTEKLNHSEAVQNQLIELTEKLNHSEAVQNQLTELTEKINKLSEAVQILSTKVDEMADRSGTTTATTNMDVTENTVKSTSPTIEKIDSCLSHYNEGRTENGVYTVYPLQDNNPVQVYCDMTTDGGGWTVFQRRMDGSVDFLRNWQDYKQGFGNLTGEFWLGNDNIASLTSMCCHELRIELEDFDGVRKYAKYGKFKVLPESDDYKLEVSLYSGNAGDSLDNHNGKEFTTTDRDNDRRTYTNCAVKFKGAWWYNSCHHSNLNGMYLKGPSTPSGEGVNWRHWRGWKYSLKMTEMKLR